jgi:hypothetical protein
MLDYPVGLQQKAGTALQRFIENAARTTGVLVALASVDLGPYRTSSPNRFQRIRVNQGKPSAESGA